MFYDSIFWSNAINTMVVLRKGRNPNKQLLCLYLPKIIQGFILILLHRCQSDGLLLSDHLVYPLHIGITRWWRHLITFWDDHPTRQSKMHMRLLIYFDVGCNQTQPQWCSKFKHNNIPRVHNKLHILFSSRNNCLESCHTFSSWTKCQRHMIY